MSEPKARAAMPPRQVEAAIRELIRLYGIRNPGRREPFASLVFTVLSQHTADTVSVPVARELLRRFPAPAALAGASIGELEHLLEPAGLHRQKARRLRELGRLLVERYGGDAGRLLALPPDRMRAELLSISGVGEKTADCFLLFAAGLPVLPVDTHVARIARRWGLAGEGARYGDARAALEAAVPPRLRGRAHLALIAHGRAACRARMPLCEGCAVSDICPHYRWSQHASKR